MNRIKSVYTVFYVIKKISDNTYIMVTTLQSMLNVKNFFWTQLNIRSPLSNIFEFSSF